MNIRCIKGSDCMAIRVHICRLGSTRPFDGCHGGRQTFSRPASVLRSASFDAFLFSPIGVVGIEYSASFLLRSVAPSACPRSCLCSPS